ncbi:MULTISPECIES: dTDP-4-dehydrorhamnose reductase [unclassified Arcicella]|uniref:dTDP-4-dehydrorhamnose reductase n=1 Tax=unclassified Arcicella TaxID=2644986 RepID=UPI002861B6F6|nr:MULTISPECIES: dTDP-4-dehydrorhamnose reductase [unclassified Arcicella]MDR6564808.1 dTDP-4-dehydrorhamnose reductase [Arcicella sp. BE51]MDR6814604.1 dTDP-4-dehydrorhamnose reductase [Arcicella sp. BE140]MDR6825982.1 dTDP-4-dehydrorhamnose reductase [Arcicella sp. BE139]
MSIIIFGGIGQLGQCINKVAESQNIEGIIYLDEIEGNILDVELLENLFTKHKPSYVVNCAAYTAVDKAEDDVDLARKINKTGAANLADACVAHGSTLIHVSTDFVFEGNLPKALSEEDEATPIGMYGLTKLEGEQDIINKMSEFFILRTSWLYSEFANNFVKTMLRLGKERPELGIIVDQVGTPTYGVDLAACILHIITTQSKDYGLYNYSNEGAISWYDFAQAIFELGEVSVKVKPLKTSEYPTKAKRPAFSLMDKTKIKQVLGIEIPYWRDSLKVCMAALA